MATASKGGACQRAWRFTTALMRVICVTLLFVMFSYKVRDYIGAPVVSSTDLVPAPLPAITVCPAALNETVHMQLFPDWWEGNVTTEEILQMSAVEADQLVASCATTDGTPCGSWQRRRVPPSGITCYTLPQRSDAVQDEVATELLLELNVFGELTNGLTLYQVFLHAEKTPKTFYGGGLVSAYHLVRQGFMELVVTRSERVNVNKRQRPCDEDPDLDVNQCLLDCYSRAAFSAANCSVQWGADTAGLPPCRTLEEYDAARDAWRSGRPRCDCPRPCRQQQVTLNTHDAMPPGMSQTIQLQIRFDGLQMQVEERFAYSLVDLLVDLGGTLGLLLGYSLVHVVALGDQLVEWLTVYQQKRQTGDEVVKKVVGGQDDGVATMKKRMASSSGSEMTIISP